MSALPGTSSTMPVLAATDASRCRHRRQDGHRCARVDGFHPFEHFYREDAMPDPLDLPDGVLDAMVQTIGMLEAHASELESQARTMRSFADWLKRAVDDPSLPAVAIAQPNGRR